MPTTAKNIYDTEKGCWITNDDGRWLRPKSTFGFSQTGIFHLSDVRHGSKETSCQISFSSRSGVGNLFRFACQNLQKIIDYIVLRADENLLKCTAVLDIFRDIRLKP